MLIKVNSTFIDPASSTDDIMSRSKSVSCLSKSISPTKNSIPSSTSTTNLKSCSNMSRRFHTSQLGRPPGSTSHQKSSTQTKPKQPTHTTATTARIAPLKEVEKLIADLKKENFDLKLRLYHLEDLISKDPTFQQLHEENEQLRIENKRLEALLLKERVDAGTQTTTQTFESSPEAFNLLPAPPKRGGGYGQSSWQRLVANEDHLGSVVHALQQFKIDNNNNTNNDNHPSKSRRPCI